MPRYADALSGWWWLLSGYVLELADEGIYSSHDDTQWTDMLYKFA